MRRRSVPLSEILRGHADTSDDDDGGATIFEWYGNEGLGRAL